MIKWLILGALLSSAAGCAPMPASASPSGVLPGVLLTFERTGGLIFSGYELALFEDGRLEHQRWGRIQSQDWDDVPIAPPEMARVRASLERLSALPPDCCDCRNMTDQSWVIMTFRVAGGTEVKKIDHYATCHRTPWVYDVEDEIEDALGAERWFAQKAGGTPRHARRD